MDKMYKVRLADESIRLGLDDNVCYYGTQEEIIEFLSKKEDKQLLDKAKHYFDGVLTPVHYDESFNYKELFIEPYFIEPVIIDRSAVYYNTNTNLEFYTEDDETIEGKIDKIDAQFYYFRDSDLMYKRLVKVKIQGLSIGKVEFKDRQMDDFHGLLKCSGDTIENTLYYCDKVFGDMFGQFMDIQNPEAPGISMITLNLLMGVIDDV